MADFCWSCTEKLGVDGHLNDFNASINPDVPKEDHSQVLREGCGFIVVDVYGRKVDEVKVPNVTTRAAMQEARSMRKASHRRLHRIWPKGRERRSQVMKFNLKDQYDKVLNEYYRDPADEAEYATMARGFNWAMGTVTLVLALCLVAVGGAV